ncbi:hypothetical protein [Rhizobium favelukesii]|uniref:Uncharacterized protein n=1 Tax=Rhizobium favelukesii TaxID=348824 RepID=W6RS48_9HYPH|nr:hypothetical protein [Rhizobium favelukesii]MCS0460839.1 hypothetical protein [Rhizobium favelukesii]CDM57181.1 hypothetical protein LPU83_1509 [Rhizobium favelukesii]
MERSTAEHRAAVEAWRASAPKHDHEIFGRKLKTEKPRHKDLSQLSALLAMRSRAVGVAEGVEEAAEIPTISTNWRIVAANDNQPPEEDEGFGTERAVEYEPSLDLLEAEIEHLPVRHRVEPMVRGGRSDREVHAIPVDGDVAYGTHVDEDDKPHKVIVRIGRLRFSDGSQTEKGHKLVMDKVVNTDLKMPVGSMLGSREKSTRDRGGEDDTSGSNAHYRWIVKGRVATPAKLHPTKDQRVEISKAQARQIIADAMAKTDVVITKCPDGFPYGPTNLRQLFIGGRKGKKGESGSQAWADIFTEKENRDAFTRGLDAMQEKHVRVLTEAMTAKSLSALGEARGYRGRHAVDAGRRLLRAANDNFTEAMKLAEFAAEA